MWTVHASREPVLYNMTDLPYYSGLTQTFLGFSLVYHKYTKKNVCLPLATSTVLSIYRKHYTKVTNWRAVLSYFISRMPQPHPTKNESKMTQSICATMICHPCSRSNANFKPSYRTHVTTDYYMYMNIYQLAEIIASNLCWYKWPSLKFVCITLHIYSRLLVYLSNFSCSFSLLAI